LGEFLDVFGEELLFNFGWPGDRPQDANRTAGLVQQTGYLADSVFFAIADLSIHLGLPLILSNQLANMF
jgi:hypothetical protein